jgi:hypothetical protein
MLFLAAYRSWLHLQSFRTVRLDKSMITKRKLRIKTNSTALYEPLFYHGRSIFGVGNL